MTQPGPGLTSREVLSNVAGDFRRRLPQLLAYEILFKVITAAVLGPLSAWVFAALISSTGRRVLSNEEILAFLLSPLGLITLVLWGGVGLATLFAEQAGMMLIAWQTIRRQRATSAGALWNTARSLPTLLALGIRQTLIYGLAILPFLAIAAITCFTLLSGHNINYYLAETPPVFWVAVAIGAILAAGAGFVCAALYFRWIFAVPICLFEGKTSADALRGSRSLVKSSLLRIAALLLGWTLLVAAAAALVMVPLHFLGELLLTSLGNRLSLVIPAVAGLLTVGALLVAAFSFVGFAVNCVLVTHLYCDARARIGRPLHKREDQNAEHADDPSAGWAPSRRVLWSAAAVVAVFTALTSYAIVESLDLEDRVEVTAHRGSSRNAPENSLSAIRQAIRDGADFAEIDVQETSDGVVVLLHDDDLMRVAGVSRKIWETSYAEIENLDAGSWFSPQFAGEKIPTLAEAIQAAGDQIKLNIELKFNGHDDRLAERVVRTIQDHGFQSRCVLSSLSYPRLMEAKRLEPRIPVGHIVFKTVGDVTRFDVDFLSMKSDLVDEALVSTARKADKQIHVWTVNDPRRMTAFIDLGVNNIITDEPAELVGILEQRAALTDLEQVLLKLRSWLYQ